MSQQPPRPAVMDPLHMTEFASDRYFAKITQEREAALKQQQQQQTQQQSSQLQQSAPSVAGPSVPVTPSVPLALPATSSQFILPVREAKSAEVPQPQVVQPTEQKQKKSRFGGIGRLLHSKAQPAPAPIPPSTVYIPAATETYHPQRLSGSEYVKPRTLPFDELFAGLPTELQIQVIASLPLSDILNLRLSSKSWHAMVTINEGPIVRAYLDSHIPAYAKRLYPPDLGNLDLHYLCGLWHRLHVAAKVSCFIGEWVTKEIFLRTTEAQKLEFAPKKERMRRRLIPLLFTIFHFFETYRAKHMQYLLDHDGKGLQQTPYTLNPIEAEVMAMYDDRTLLQVHQVFPLVVASFCRRLRPPSYAGRVERSIRGYLREKPADEVHVAALCIGGLRQVERFWEIKGYNTRRGAVDTWYNSIAKEPVVETTPKPRRGLMGLGRKKSLGNIKDATVGIVDASAPPVPPLPPSWGRGATENWPFPADPRATNLIFNTSLAAGMPMGPMSKDSLRLLLPDLPVLQQMWLTTAEAIILDKKIVERASDIRRNAAVMLELIREDGLAEEDEWWYGQGSHDSVRPPLDSIEEDPVEEPPPP